MNARPVDRCGLCGGPVESVLHLGSSPPTCVMRKVGEPDAGEVHYPLEVLYCHDCMLGQLSVEVDPGIVFPPEYPYTSGTSKQLHKNFGELAHQAKTVANLGADDLVVDIGANDGTLLSKFDRCRTLGVEPTRQAHKIQGAALCGFFDCELAEQVVDEFGKAKVVTACNVLAHVNDIHDVMRGVSALLDDDGVFIAENHDLRSVVHGRQWDTVYHEHLRFYSPYSFYKLCREHGLMVLGWEEIPTHGGSFRMVARKQPIGIVTGVAKVPPRHGYDWSGLRKDAAHVRAALRREALQQDPPLWGIGATARATTILNYCGLDQEDVCAVAEVAGSDKIGRLVPGTRIPVVDEQRLLDEQPPRAILLSWHLAQMIATGLRERGFEGELIAPLPILRRV